MLRRLGQFCLDFDYFIILSLSSMILKIAKPGGEFTDNMKSLVFVIFTALI